MNFTLEVKREIIARCQKRRMSGEEKRAALSAFLRTSGILGSRDSRPAFFIVSETEKVAEFFISLFEETFSESLTATHVSVDRLSGKGKLLLEYLGSRTEEILKDLRLLDSKGEIRLGVSRRIVATEEAELAYITAAFLGGGSLTLPSEGTGTGYHLEIVLPDRKTAADFCLLLSGAEIIARTITRGTSYVVYIKSKETISDFLALVGAEKSLEKFGGIVEKRDEATRNNRAANCFSGNADKTAKASVKQVMALEKLQRTEAWSSLSPELKDLAAYRLNNPTLSLQELADSLGVSKSCLNHRMRRLMALAQAAIEAGIETTTKQADKQGKKDSKQESIEG